MHDVPTCCHVAAWCRIHQEKVLVYTHFYLHFNDAFACIRLSQASVESFEYAQRQAFIEDALKAAREAEPVKDHVAMALAVLTTPEKCPQPKCNASYEVRIVASFCVHNHSHVDAAHHWMHSHALYNV